MTDMPLQGKEGGKKKRESSNKHNRAQRDPLARGGGLSDRGVKKWVESTVGQFLQHMQLTAAFALSCRPCRTFKKDG